MKPIERALAKEGVVGDPTPSPWQALNHMLELHTKELVIIAGAPTAGKSLLALNWVMGTDEPTLYCAQDSAPSVYARTAALAMGEKINRVKDMLRSPEGRLHVVSELRGEHPNLFIHDGPVSVEELEQRIIALTEFLGKAPTYVILDNLNDLLVEGYVHSEVGFYAAALNPLKQVAIRHGVCLMALHHVTRSGGEKGNPHGLGMRALRMTDLMFSGEREAEHVVGVYHSASKNNMYVQVLKQRDGDGDADGGIECRLSWLPEHGRLERG